MFGDKPLCLLCNATVALVKECNLKRNYTTKHSEKFYSIIGEERKVKINSLRGSLCKQQDIFTKQDTESAKSTCASFAISEIIGRKMKPKKPVANISLSARTVTRRIEDLSADVKLSLKELTRQFEFFAIALDESTDLKDTAQVAVFIRGINAHFDITEEFASLVPLRDTTTGLNIFNAVKSVIDDFGLKLDDLCGMATDGAPAMTGTVNGAVSLIEKEMRNVGFERNLVRTHYIMHLEVLYAKSLRMQEVMRVVVKTVNFVRSRGLNHRQFQ
ncbi:general transcription factor II-I repeat domain-containing protein 2-like [Oopsacas minuta]|uniref:General transcription factor II-I repeat domain-containing protein 2-like n=1 Tax=Oopsacas minuta TaxID=111878 RepID=A0AAV7KE60_9METZ|nr:general transcription factor II-I repeat domain-containing protein 2-like [Oopsacas minuta]